MEARAVVARTADEGARPASGGDSRTPRARVRTILNATVVVSALGYFVDIYDLILFAVVRVPSLTDLGYSGGALLSTGVFLLNAQMVGMLLGGVLWGVLGDKRGRVSVLFGSILLYSIANLANAVVTNVTAYAVLRFVAGVGLAGELGAAITLVSEVMTRETRGYGAAVVAGVGILGAIAAALVARATTWRVAYVVGGLLGLALLLLRYRLRDSGMFRALDGSAARRGDLRLLLRSGKRARTFLACALVGLPIWYAIGIVATFSPELARELGVRGTVAAGTVLLACYAGLAAGDLASGIISQRIGSRRWALYAFVVLTAAAVFAILLPRGLPAGAFYALCVALGASAGYWAVMMTTSAEQFGTNLRATVTTTVPNLIRGSVVPMTLAFQALAAPLGLARSALWVGAGALLVALASIRFLDETYGKDLDYVEM